MLPRPVVQGKGVWIRNIEWTGAHSQAVRHYDACGLSCLGMLQVTWESKALLGAAELCFFKVHEGKLFSQAAELSSCVVFSFALSPASC